MRARSFHSGMKDLQDAYVSGSLASTRKPGRISDSKTPSVFAVVPYPPNPVRPRTVSMLRDISSFAEIDLVYLDHGDNFELPTDVRLRTITALPNRSCKRLMRIVAGCLKRKPIVYQYYNSTALTRHIAARSLSQYDALYFERIPIHELNVKHHNIILDSIDCFANIVSQLAFNAPGIRRLGYKLDKRCIQEYEAELCNSARLILCTAEREARSFRTLGVTRPIEVIVHSSNLNVCARRTVVDGTKRVLSFHGKLTYSANVAALGVLQTDIMDRIDSSLYEIWIAGAGSESLSAQYPRLRFRGYVEDIQEHLQSAHLSVLPVEFGGGVSNKALESFAAGVPVVATVQIKDGLPQVESVLEQGLFVRGIRDFPETIENYFRLPLERRQKISETCVEYARRVQDGAERRERLKTCFFPAEVK